MNENVGIVIVSHSADVARGTAMMVEQMVGREVPLGWCGGDPDGGLGTNVEAIMAAIDQAWSEKGVAILVDLGGAETNSEMAIEMLPETRRGRASFLGERSIGHMDPGARSCELIVDAVADVMEGRA